MAKLDLTQVPLRTGSTYPAPYAAQMGDRGWLALGEAGGLTQFGVNLVVMQPGSRSSLRHWHSHEDEFLMVVSGELVLIDDRGEQALRQGDCAAYRAGDENAHHLVNRSDHEARFLVTGTSHPADICTYPDEDMSVRLVAGQNRFSRGNGREVV